MLVGFVFWHVCLFLSSCECFIVCRDESTCSLYGKVNLSENYGFIIFTTPDNFLKGINHII